MRRSPQNREQFSDAEVDRVARTLGTAPLAAYTTPIVYPWAVQNFATRPMAARPSPQTGRLRLYVHIPFCHYHCTFCFYAVRTGAKRAEMERYVDALARELEWIRPGAALTQLVVGGGTPTALPPELLDRVLAAIVERTAPPAADACTLEASPDSLTAAHIRILQRRGIGGVSIGIESMDDAVLGTVHRRHTPAQGLAACRMAADAGLALNVDLIYGLPGQTEESFRRDLAAVAECGARTLCLYALRLNEKTPVAKQLSAADRLDLARLMRWRAFVTRAAAEVGYVQTRSYTYKRADSGPSWHERAVAASDGPRHELGIGMSARSQLDDVVYRNHDQCDVYMDRVEHGHSPVESVFELDVRDRKTQFIAASLGNGKALDRASYERTFGVSIDADFAALLERLRAAELVDDDNVCIVLTETGKLVYDRVLLCFYPDRATKWLHTWAARPRRAAATTQLER